MHPRTRAFLVCVALLACDRPPTSPPTSPKPALHEVGPLTPGMPARVRGTALAGKTTILVDETPVPLVPETDTSASFIAPAMRPCDTDGRRIPVALLDAPSRSVTAELRLATTLSLQVGESRIVESSAGDGCFQLPAADADFVISALNTSLARTEHLDTLATLTAWTATDPAPQDLLVGSASLRPVTPLQTKPLGNPSDSHLRWPEPYSLAPTLFDPSYPTAQPGDTVRFVDWDRAGSCSIQAAAAPSYPAVVAAASGLTVIAVDLRLATANEYISPAGRAILQNASEIADPLVLPAMRRVFDAGYQPLPAAGGRHYHIVTALSGVARSSDGNTSKPQSLCLLASEMVATLVAPPALTNPLASRALATTIVHEYAHNAGEITARRFGHGGGAIGWMDEAWAVNAEETAARISVGAVSRAKLSSLGATAPFRAGTTNSDWGLYPNRSPWTGVGAYKQGAALIAYARELAGEARLDEPAPKLYRRLLEHDTWTLDGLAARLGTAPASLLDAWSWTDATDDLIAPSASHPGALLSWDDAERVVGNEGPRGGFPPEARPSRAIGRNGARTNVALAAAPGSYAAAYLFAEGSLGLTVQLRPRPDGPGLLRITRTR